MDQKQEHQEELEFSQGENFFPIKEKDINENRVSLGGFYKKDIIYNDGKNYIEENQKLDYSLEQPQIDNPEYEFDEDILNMPGANDYFQNEDSSNNTFDQSGSAEQKSQRSWQYWARFKCLSSDASLQLIAMEKLKSLILEIIQVERNYEIQLRRIGQISKQIQKNLQTGSYSQNQKIKDNKGEQSTPKDSHSELYNTALQCLQNYCLQKADLVLDNSKVLGEELFVKIKNTLDVNERNVQKLNIDGNDLVRKLRELQMRTQVFNSKYIQEIGGPKKQEGVLSSIKGFFVGKSQSTPSQKTLSQISQNENISKDQQFFQQAQTQQSVFKLLDEKIEMKSNVKKKFMKDVKELQSYSESFRSEYARKMADCLDNLEGVMNSNLNLLQNVFDKYYQINCNQSNKQQEIANALNNDFKKIDIAQEYQKYISYELPLFDPKWLTEEFTHKDHVLFKKINDQLELQAQQKKRNQQPIVLPDVSIQRQRISIAFKLNQVPNSQNDEKNMESIKLALDSSIKILNEENSYSDKNKEVTQFMDQIMLEKNPLLRNQQNEINKILLKAWFGESELQNIDLKQFQDIIAFKQGQLLFVHILNQFRVRRQHQIKNETAMQSLSKLIKTVLKQVLNEQDVSVALNCHVLASTYFLPASNSDDLPQKEFLFERIKKEPIWQNLQFWERTLIYYLQHEIIMQRNDIVKNEMEKNDMSISLQFSTTSYDSKIPDNNLQDKVTDRFSTLNLDKALQMRGTSIRQILNVNDINDQILTFKNPLISKSAKQSSTDARFGSNSKTLVLTKNINDDDSENSFLTRQNSGNRNDNGATQKNEINQTKSLYPLAGLALHDILYITMLHIQHDMFSFQVPINICRELLHKFLKTSSLARQFILPEMADQILMLLENEEEKMRKEQIQETKDFISKNDIKKIFDSEEERRQNENKAAAQLNNSKQ